MSSPCLTEHAHFQKPPAVSLTLGFPDPAPAKSLVQVFEEKGRELLRCWLHPTCLAGSLAPFLPFLTAQFHLPLPSHLPHWMACLITWLAIRQHSIGAQVALLCTLPEALLQQRESRWCWGNSCFASTTYKPMNLNSYSTSENENTSENERLPQTTIS